MFAISSLGGPVLADDLVLAAGWPRKTGAPSTLPDSGDHLKIDRNSGRIVVTGRAQYESSTTKSQIATWVHNPDGTLAWVRLWPTLPPVGESSGVAVALDPAGNITVAGVYYAPGEDLNIVVLRYNQNGALLFERTYNNAAQNGEDYPVDIEAAQDSSGLIVVGGVTTTPFNGTDYFLWALDTAGATLGIATYDGAHAPDVLADIDMLDVTSSAAGAGAAGDILVTGTGTFPNTKSDILTVEFDYVEDVGLVPVWCEQFTNYPNQPIEDGATCCKLYSYATGDRARFVGGYTSSPDSGERNWLVRGVTFSVTPCGAPFEAIAWGDVLDGGLDKDDVVNKIQLDITPDRSPENPSELRLYAVGTLTIDNQQGAAETEGFAIGYNPFNGFVKWQRSSGIAGDDTAVDLTTNPEGHLYYVGSKYDFVNELYDCVTKKVDSVTGLPLAEAIYNTPGDAKDLGTAIEVNAAFTSPEFPDVCVAGRTTLQVERYLLIRYLNPP
jgi:hypothetical protein